VLFYGAPVPPVDGLERLGAPVLAIYAELDRTLTRSVPAVITRLLRTCKSRSVPLSAQISEAVTSGSSSSVYKHIFGGG